VAIEQPLKSITLWKLSFVHFSKKQMSTFEDDTDYVVPLSMEFVNDLKSLLRVLSGILVEEDY
jgi:hypothetical protein